MTRQSYLEQFKILTKKMYDITAGKNSDYATDADALSNFTFIEKVRSTIKAEDGVYVRMCDKFVRVGNLMERAGVVTDESIEDTLIDLANYSLILLICLREADLGEDVSWEIPNEDNVA